MNVLHICSYYENVLFENLVHALGKHDISNEVYVFYPKERISEDFKNTKEKVTLDYCYKKNDRVFFHLKHKKVKDSFINEYEKRIHKFDCIYAHSLFSNGYIAYYARKKWGIPYVVIVQNTDLNVFFKYMKHLRKLGIEIMMNADKIIFASQAYVDEIDQKYISQKNHATFKSKAVVIPYGIDDYYFDNQSSRVKRNASINVLSVGTICYNKNHLKLAKAVELLTQKGYDINLTVIGSFSNKKIVDKLLKYNFIKCVDYIEKTELINYMRQADIFALTSKKETFGLVYGESLSQGCPVIYSKGQGFDQQFKEGLVGYHVNANDYKSIAKGIEKLLENNIEQDICKKNAEKFRWSNVSKKYYDIFNEIMEARCGQKC